MAENKKLLVENADLKDRAAQLVQKTLTLEFDRRLLEARIESLEQQLADKSRILNLVFVNTERRARDNPTYLKTNFLRHEDRDTSLLSSEQHAPRAYHPEVDYAKQPVFDQPDQTSSLRNKFAQFDDDENMGEVDDDNPEDTDQDGQENSGENFQSPVPPPGDFPTPVSPIMSPYTAPSSVLPRVLHDHTRQRLARNPQSPAPVQLPVQLPAQAPGQTSAQQLVQTPGHASLQTSAQDTSVTGESSYEVPINTGISG